MSPGPVPRVGRTGAIDVRQQRLAVGCLPVLALVENARGMLNEVAGRLRALVDRIVEAAGQADGEAGRELQSGGDDTDRGAPLRQAHRARLRPGTPIIFGSAQSSPASVVW
jgi:hypothetical protein